MTLQDETELRVRFNLRLIFLILTLLAIVFAMLFTTPEIVAIPCLMGLSVMLPGILTAGLVYGTDRWRAFCLGGLFPSGVMLLATAMWVVSIRSIDRMTFEDADYYRAISVVSWALILLTGGCSVVIRDLGRT